MIHGIFVMALRLTGLKRKSELSAAIETYLAPCALGRSLQVEKRGSKVDITGIELWIRENLERSNSIPSLIVLMF